jgi:peptidoglycan/xylan/chitin deacetylase (PgdA/CDA1 family)
MHRDFQIGVHTRDHLALPERSHRRIALELEGCIADVNVRIGERPCFFSFPYGRSSHQSRRQVAEHFRAAVVTDPPALVHERTDRFAMPRVFPPDDAALFRLYTSGAYPDLVRRLLRRA